MVSRETEQVIAKIREGALEFKIMFENFNNYDRIRAIEMFIDWLDKQKFTEDE